MKTDRSSRRMWRWAAVGIALLAVLAFLLTVRRAPRRQIPNTGAPDTFATNLERAYSRVHAVAQPAEVHTPGAVLTDQLCGMKGPELRRAANETIGQHVMRVTHTVISGWISSLVASEDPRRQAIGLALENAHPGAPGDRGKDTPVNNNLVLLAIETNDPLIYALALSQCGDPNQDSGPCQALSWEHLANIPPRSLINRDQNGRATPSMWVRVLRPACPVVWQGRAGNRVPYADLRFRSAGGPKAEGGRRQWLAAPSRHTAGPEVRLMRRFRGGGWTGRHRTCKVWPGGNVEFLGKDGTHAG